MQKTKVNKLSIVTIARNEAKYIETFLKSIQWADEVILVDNDSTDNTAQIAQNYTTKIYKNSEKNLGLLKQFGLQKATSNWILLLDVDEIPTLELQTEIKTILSSDPQFDVYKIPYQNHFLGYPLLSETYAKVRLFKKNVGSVSPLNVHEEIEVHGKKGNTKGKILHYSYRSVPQVLKKFTNYAIRETDLLKKKGEKVTLKKLILYPLHMFWARFFESKGYKDGIGGLLLALCFAYYEFARYFFLWKAILNIEKEKN